MKTPATILSLCLAYVLLLATPSHAQLELPIKWYFMATSINEKEAVLTFTAVMEEGWHVYSQHLEKGGPLPTTFVFEPSHHYTLVGKVKEESIPSKIFDKNFQINTLWFSRTAVFTQRVRLHTHTTTIKGKVEFMVASNYQYLSPEQVTFSLGVRVDKSQ
jgi:hypothetical protein